ncbi:LamG domain-containing protein [Flavivirga algicola]|uniref:Beta-agarase n=1 Tax=Flavivirga algicola TaxID=2729136 RepID=A0ABX1RU77_9FLAO|nr:beta-agarase [Flavivirga algicola]NMH85987.1 beta-agarase [Flavivirga algicola]
MGDIKNKVLVLLLWYLLVPCIMHAQLDFGNTPLPSRLGGQENWQLQEELSDDFNYTFQSTSNDMNFGNNTDESKKWKNFYHNNWTGPGPTIWQKQNVSVSDGYLNIWASRNPGEMKTFFHNGQRFTKKATRAGCVTSLKKVKYPVFVETRIRVMNSVMASNTWLLSPTVHGQKDDQEIDIIECYGGAGADNRNVFFANKIHLSHHAFRKGLSSVLDYQPSDRNSWWTKNGVNQWGGKWVRVGVYWQSATRVEYYIDGELARIVDDKAIETRIDNHRIYTYPDPDYTFGSGANGQIITHDPSSNSNEVGYQRMLTARNLEEAKSKSQRSVIDPLNYMKTEGKWTKELEIIINIEDQSWLAAMDITPTDEELSNFQDNNLLVDWIRVYKPVNLNGD